MRFYVTFWPSWILVFYQVGPESKMELGGGSQPYLIRPTLSESLESKGARPAECLFHTFIHINFFVWVGFSEVLLRMQLFQEERAQGGLADLQT